MTNIYAYELMGVIVFALITLFLSIKSNRKNGSSVVK